MQDLVGRLTIDEMVAQMSHGGGTSANGNFIFGIIRSATETMILLYHPQDLYLRRGVNGLGGRKT